MKRLDLRSDRAESSVMQVVALAVSTVVAASSVSFIGTMLNASHSIQAEQHTQTYETIASRQMVNDIEDAHAVHEATATHMQFDLNDRRCVTYSIQLDAQRATTLVRTQGGCGSEENMLPTDKVLLTHLSADSSFTFRNIAGLTLTNAVPSGTCDSFYLPIECTSTVPFVISLDAAVINPVVGKTPFLVTGTTDAVRLTMQADGDADVETPETIPGDMEPVSP